MRSGALERREVLANLEMTGDRLLTSPEEWLQVLEKEYLADYICSGGSSVKVVSGSNEHLQQVQGRLQEVAAQGGYFYTGLDPSRLNEAGKRPDLHRIDKFFFTVTQTVDWKAWAAEQAKQYLQSRGIFLAEGRRLNDLENIAADNGRDTQDLLYQYQSEFATPQIRDHGLAVEFRAAVTALGRAQLISDAVTPTTEEVILAWFAGRTMAGAAAALKKVGIFERINQANARYMLSSFCRWLPKTGHNGLVITLDLRPYEYKRLSKTQRQAEHNRFLRAAIDRGASQEELETLVTTADSEPEVSYSDGAFIQMLTLLRRFIDEIDWFERFFLVVLTTPKFYDETSKRQYGLYDALQTRIGLEVHDVRRANPCAALVHLGAKP